jgi:hypothetical protein
MSVMSAHPGFALSHFRPGVLVDAGFDVCSQLRTEGGHM